MEQLQQISSLKAKYYSQRIYYIASKPSSPPCRLYFLSSPRDLILTCTLSILKRPHSYLNLSSPVRLSSEAIFSSNSMKATHMDCSIYCILKRSSKYSFQILRTSTFSRSANLPWKSFILLQFFTFPPFALHTSFQSNFLLQFTSSFQTVHVHPSCSDMYTF